jgi:hypothetical protein
MSQFLQPLLSNPYFLAFGIPFINILLGTRMRRLARNKPGEKLSDWYFGMSAAQGTFFAATVKIIENPSLTHDLIVTTLGAGVSSLLIWSFIASIHRDHDDDNLPPWRRIFWLLIVSNVLGLSIWIIYIFLVKGL